MNIKQAYDNYSGWIFWMAAWIVPLFIYTYQKSSIWFYALCFVSTFFFAWIFWYDIRKQRSKERGGDEPSASERQS
jgi:hypothetical protein